MLQPYSLRMLFVVLYYHYGKFYRCCLIRFFIINLCTVTPPPPPPTQTSIYRLSTIEKDSSGRSFITFEAGGGGRSQFQNLACFLGLGFRRSFSNK